MLFSLFTYSFNKQDHIYYLEIVMDGIHSEVIYRGQPCHSANLDHSCLFSVVFFPLHFPRKELGLICL